MQESSESRTKEYVTQMSLKKKPSPHTYLTNYYEILKISKMINGKLAKKATWIEIKYAKHNFIM
jgi:hypothetical protein